MIISDPPPHQSSKVWKILDLHPRDQSTNSSLQVSRIWVTLSGKRVLRQIMKRYLSFRADVHQSLTKSWWDFSVTTGNSNNALHSWPSCFTTAGKKAIPWTWGSEQESAFENLLEHLSSPLIFFLHSKCKCQYSRSRDRPLSDSGQSGRVIAFACRGLRREKLPLYKLLWHVSIRID